VREPLAELVRLLVEGNYEELAARARSVRAEALRERMEEDYRTPLDMPPEDHYETALVIPIKGKPNQWGVVLDLWGEGKIADLHLDATLEEVSPGVFTALFEDVAP
jgi:hypothetical protein